MGLLRRYHGIGLGGLENEGTRAVMQRLHGVRLEGHAAELHQIALLQELFQQAAVARQRGLRGRQQVVQEFLGGAMGGGDGEAAFDVTAHDVGDGDRELACGRRVQERTDGFERL